MDEAAAFMPQWLSMPFAKIMPKGEGIGGAGAATAPPIIQVTWGCRAPPIIQVGLQSTTNMSGGVAEHHQ